MSRIKAFYCDVYCKKKKNNNYKEKYLKIKSICLIIIINLKKTRVSIIGRTYNAHIINKTIYIYSI